ncbi:type IV toxin-antitoxin system AbiEi family antitoxin domain-containing protein [Nocardioides sp. KR10-350]|uniref:type IV toxin-antitoxin system AbiEi family antitoxin domain-containing protein n=1 Tax=Nocardioides cheoyonin TaxID=3156615 RepID=UPI0032B4D369
MAESNWSDLARAQGGLVTRAQLRELGVSRWAVRDHVAAGRWVVRTSTVIGTTTGTLTREETMWLGVLQGGTHALVGGMTAAEVHGLKNWHRDNITVLVPYDNDVQETVPGVEFVRTRRPLSTFRRKTGTLPLCLLEPAVLLWAAAERNPRSAQGALAAVVQQQLTTPDLLTDWLARLRPLRKAPLFRRTIDDMRGGAQSLAEMEIKRMCRAYGIAQPQRQVRRRDGSGRLRFTDCEWRLADGRTLCLEVDGGFHMEVEHWEDDLARQRALSAPDRVIVRCTSREVRDEPATVAADLKRLGVPRAA